MTISGKRTEQFDIFCCVTGFTSDCLSFIDVELVRFFHGAVQLLMRTEEQQQFAFPNNICNSYGRQRDSRRFMKVQHLQSRMGAP